MVNHEDLHCALKVSWSFEVLLEYFAKKVQTLSEVSSFIDFTFVLNYLNSFSLFFKFAVHLEFA
jgi:hypothetical protein